MPMFILKRPLCTDAILLMVRKISYHETRNKVRPFPCRAIVQPLAMPCTDDARAEITSADIG